MNLACDYLSILYLCIDERSEKSRFYPFLTPGEGLECASSRPSLSHIRQKGALYHHFQPMVHTFEEFKWATVWVLLMRSRIELHSLNIVSAQRHSGTLNAVVYPLCLPIPKRDQQFNRDIVSYEGVLHRADNSPCKIGQKALLWAASAREVGSFTPPDLRRLAGQSASVTHRETASSLVQNNFVLSEIHTGEKAPLT